MGIPGLWDLISDCEEIVSLAEFATQHFEQHKRPLRIAVDEATWRHKLYISGGNVKRVGKKYKNLNLNERNLVSVVLRLLKLNIQLIFVADGPHKPDEKYDGKGAGVCTYENDVLHRFLKVSGVKWHNAPGEAEAECALLQRRGTVDCVWTEDADALMFGCAVLMRFSYWEDGDGEEKEKGMRERWRGDGKGKGKGKGRGRGGGGWKLTGGGMKDLDRVVMYRASVIKAKHPGFDREGLVLFVMLRGGDYGKGLLDCGVRKASKAVEMGFGRELCEATKTSGDLSTWRKNLRNHFIGSRSGVSVPEDFPCKRILGLYNEPCVSSVERLEKLEENVWKIEIDEKKLQSLFVEKFDWGIDKYIEFVVPILLTQSLASVKRNWKSNMDKYHLTYIEDGLRCTVWYSLFAVTSLGKEWVNRCIEDLNKKRSEKNWKYYQLPWGEEPWVEGKDLLTCIVKHAVEPEIPLVPEFEPEKLISKDRRRSFSLQRTILDDQTREKKHSISVSPPQAPQDRFAITKEEIRFDTTMYEELDDELVERISTAIEQSPSSSPSFILDEQEITHGYDASAEMALESLQLSRKFSHRLRSPAYTDPNPPSTRDNSTDTPFKIKTNTISENLPPALPSPPYTITKEEFASTFIIAMDEPLDLDSESESLDAVFSISKISKPHPVPPLDKLQSHTTSHIASQSFSSDPNLQPFDTKNSLPIRSIPTDKGNVEFELENDTFAIAMDEPLDLDSETESLDARLSISAIARPFLKSEELTYNSQSPFPSNLETNFISTVALRTQDQSIGTKKEVTNRDTNDDTFDIAMDEEVDLNDKSPHRSTSASPRAPEIIPRPNTDHLSNLPAFHHLYPNTFPKLKDGSNSYLDSNLDTPNQNLNQNHNVYSNPNIILYPAHPTGPYQELDMSSFFSSQSLSQPLSPFVSQLPSQSQYAPQTHPSHTPHNTSSHDIPPTQQRPHQEIYQEMAIDMADLSDFFSSESSLHDSPPLSQI